MKRRTVLLIAACAFAADRAVKLLAESRPEPGALLPGVLAWHPTENTGMAFSLLADVPWAGAAVSLILIAAGLLLLRKFRPHRVNGLAAGLMLGGAAGNLADRLLRGSVKDMFECLFVRFAIFNAADAFLTVGAVLMAVSLLALPKEWTSKS